MPRRRYRGGRFGRRAGFGRRSRSPSPRSRSPSPRDPCHGSAYALNMRDMRRMIRNRWPSIWRSVFNYGVDDVNNPDDTPGRTPGTPVDIPKPLKPDPVKDLTVKSVDLRVAINSKAHHTDEYDISDAIKPNPKLVVRRGQPFTIEIDFNRKYDPKADDLRLVFQCSDHPLPSKGTHVEFILSDKDEPKEWGAKILSREGNSMQVTIFTPPDCFVAKWSFKVSVIKKDDKSRVNVFQYNHKDPIYILFNAFCKDDLCYIENEADRQEYLMSDSGAIYYGTCKSQKPRPWNFGQFESPVLDCVMWLLDNSDLSWSVRGNPIRVIRKLSALVNSPDDDGVLSGNWSGNYAGGRSPLSWTGSVAILNQFYETKQPVCFGQCWVFSGLGTTVARTLGIACRSVTNFASAHDTDCSITIDYHFDNDLSELSGYSSDSVWNFHVWNEAWLARPDLPTGYGGWQAFDATPQETSDGVFCCGPTSVRAIRQGEVNLPYDASFVFAEVNADKFYWQLNDEGSFDHVWTDSNAVGKFISTTTPGSDERQDVTNQYKHPEGSAEERAAVIKASRIGSTKPNLYKATAQDVKFELGSNIENTLVGKPLKVELKMKNTSNKERTVEGKITVKSMFYTGVAADLITAPTFKERIPPGKEGVFRLEIQPKEYLGKLKDCCMLDIVTMNQVLETKQIYTEKTDCCMDKPKLTLKAAREGVRDKEFKVEVSFTNPLETTLTGCEVLVDGLAKHLIFPQGNVGPNSTFNASLPITPTKKGQKNLVVVFRSTELEDINQNHKIFIRG